LGSVVVESFVIAVEDTNDCSSALSASYGDKGGLITVSWVRALRMRYFKMTLTTIRELFTL
jgi:hypothetical protein